ncbi:MarR family winged helix-turn-helix transcriptional regulator [Phycicoccus flavus]|uniref:MarR family winged helix-turn-helix transcriptional regulator n=1 Tax=Phycicoccus flavus TaxID=2502783 RepID=UPI000FEB74F6|nr:MarR family transcriptional regulator [Phycicoccus flavus]NHA68188.1 MarR family transcriptional regulator [Phycicoccus flavus]
MTDVKDALPELMARLFTRIRGELADTPMDGLRFSHVRVLAAVPSGGASVTVLADRVGMTKQGCGQFVGQLADTGHVRTVPDGGDRRVRLVELTPSGERVLAEVQRAVARVEGRLAAEAGGSRYATFRAVLEELGSSVDPRAGEGGGS